MNTDNNTHAQRQSPIDARGRPPSAPRHGTRPVFRAVVLIIVAVGLVAAGVYWHDPIAALVGKGSMGAAAPTTATSPAAAKQLWTCGMHPQVIQDHPGDCPICHMHLTPLKQDDAADGTAATGERKIAYYWDPMIGPASISDKPGKSTMNMELVPVYADAVTGGTGVKIDPVVVQNMGVRVAQVTRGPLTQTIRAVGYLREAEPLIHDVNLRVSGWIEKLYANTEGQHVDQGAALFDLYSPEVQVAVQELIAARKSGASSNGGDDLANQTSQTLLQSGRGKLSQWGLDNAQIEQLANSDIAPRTVTFKSPVSGHLTMKNVVEGANVKAGDRVLQIVNHGTLWLDVQVYEQDLPYVRLGQTVTATMQALPGESREGKIIFVAPEVDPTTRTTTVRITLDNPEMRLRPGMYARATIASELQPDAVLVPREAVIDTGTRAMTFVSAGNGRFEPRELKLGPSGDGGVSVLAGVAPGEQVVTSGQFLLDAESRMKEAIQRHLDEQLLSKQGGAGAKKNVMGNTADLPANRKEMPGMENMNGMAMPAKNPPPAATRPGAMDDMPGMKSDAPGKSNDMPGMAKPATTQATAGLPGSADVDAMYRAYLDLARQMGAQGDDAPFDAKPLIAAARRLTDVTVGPNARLSRGVLDATTAMDGEAAKAQRKAFKAVGAAVIAMAEVCPPSKAVGADKLITVHCPMVSADWLQTDETIVNPFMPTMRTCGEVKGTIAVMAGGRP